MPLITNTYFSEDINSFLDVAIKDEREINPIVNASRVQNRPDAESCSTAWMKSNSVSKGLWRDTSTGGTRRESDNESLLSMRSKEVLSSSRGGNNNDANSCGWGSRNGKTSSSTRSCNNSVDLMSSRHGSRHGVGRDDDASIIDTSKSVFSMNRTYVINSRCDGGNDLDIGDISNEHQHFLSDDDGVQLLEQEMSKIKLELAESLGQVDWYKMKYRHLHVEFQDLQAFCERLQSENMELRFDNKRAKNNKHGSSSNSVSSNNEKSAWFKSEHLMRLNRPRKWIDYEGSSAQPHRKKTQNNADDLDDDDWDDDTLTTQFCESSRFGGADETSKRFNTTRYDKPTNITVRNNRSSNNSVGGEGAKVCNVLGLEERQQQQQQSVSEHISFNNLSPREAFSRNSGAGTGSERTIQTTSMMRRSKSSGHKVHADTGAVEEEKEGSERQRSRTVGGSSIDENSVVNKIALSFMQPFIRLRPSTYPSNIVMPTKKQHNNNDLSGCKISEETPNEEEKEVVDVPTKSNNNVDKSEGSILLLPPDTNNKEAKQPKPWWMKVKIKKPFGQMHITAFENNKNTHFSDIALEDPPGQKKNLSEYSSENYGGYHSSFYSSDMPIDLSESSVTSEEQHTKKTENRRDYSQVCNEMAKRKGCVS